MRLVRLYSNRPTVFLPITFNRGLNVIVGRITKPKDSALSSHNLGKSLFAQVIDFCLLKEVKAQHFLKKNIGRFREFVFFLELETNAGIFLTIRRPVDGNTKVSFYLSDRSEGDLSDLPLEEWHESPASLAAAKASLNTHCALHAIEPYDFRKGLSYFLRGQDDYRSVFQLEKFSKGSHSEWKPFMAMWLGYSEALIREKYRIDQMIENEREFSARFAVQSGTRTTSFDKIRGLLNIKRNELQQLQRSVDLFDRRSVDSGLNVELVDEIERRTTELNDRLYSIDYELAEISRALEKRMSFDLNRVERIFKDAKIVLPQNVVRPYEELAEFYRAITDDRNKRLSLRYSELLSERLAIVSELDSVAGRRAEVLSALREADWFKRLGRFQEDIAKASAEISWLEAQLENVNQLEVIRRAIEDLEESRQKVVEEIREEIVHSNATFEAIRARFNDIFMAVFSVPALLSVSLNSESNLEFEATPVDSSVSLTPTSEGRGNTYKKVLCAAFDLALLETMARRSFYKFVYHDGIFESLDDRQKLNLLNYVRGSCEGFGLQYIMSVIDSDIPRSAAGRLVHFSESEVILELHDNGDEGRLFRMPKF